MNCEVFNLNELEVEHFQIREVLRCILHTIAFHRALGLVRPKDIDSELFEITYVQCGDTDLEKKIEEKIDQFVSWADKHPNKKSQVNKSQLLRQTRALLQLGIAWKIIINLYVERDWSKWKYFDSQSFFKMRRSLVKMCLSFYEDRNKPAAWFTNKVERFRWEQWYIFINVIYPKASGSKSHHGKASVDSGDTMMEEGNSRHAALELALRDVLFQIIRLVNEKKDHIPSVSNPDSGVVSFPYEITIASTSDSSFGMDMFKRMLQTGHPGMLS